MQTPQLLLASNSPRRRQLLSLAGYAFTATAADIDESPLPGEPPADYVLRLAREKAAAARRNAGDSLPVLAADTTVALDGEILGKPGDDAEAADMLRRLRAREHQVYTALALVTPSGEVFSDLCCTQVSMRAYTALEMDDYIAGGDPLDKAGAYAIQHPGFHPVERIAGCYANVVGLPLCQLESLLRQAGIAPRLGLPPCPPDFHACPFCRSLAGSAYDG